MRRASAGNAGGLVAVDRVGRRLAAGTDDGRAVVADAERHAGDVEFAPDVVEEIRACGRARGFPLRPGTLERFGRRVEADAVGEIARDRRIAQRRRPALELVAREERFAAPAV